MTKQIVLALFRSAEETERALETLDRMGLRAEQVSIVRREQEVQDRLGGKARHPILESAGVGAAGGAAVGGIIGLLAGASLVILPGIGPVLAGGALATALTGVGIGAAHGAFAGALIGLGMSEEHAHRYVESVRRGETLVAVETDQVDTTEVRQALKEAGAHDVDTRLGEWQVQSQPHESEGRGPQQVAQEGEDEPVTDLLADLARLCQDAHEGMRVAGRNIENPSLVKLLDGYAQQYAGQAQALREQVEARGGSSGKEGGRVAEELRRGWMNIRAAMTIEKTKTARAALATAQKSAAGVVEAYRDTLGQPLPDDLRSLLEYQYTQNRSVEERLAEAARHAAA